MSQYSKSVQDNILNLETILKALPGKINDLIDSNTNEELMEFIKHLTYIINTLGKYYSIFDDVNPKVKEEFLKEFDEIVNITNRAATHVTNIESSFNRAIRLSESVVDNKVENIISIKELTVDEITMTLDTLEDFKKNIKKTNIIVTHPVLDDNIAKLKALKLLF